MHLSHLNKVIMYKLHKIKKYKPVCILARLNLHDIVGLGVPLAIQGNIVSSPSLNVYLVGVSIKVISSEMTI